MWSGLEIKHTDGKKEKIPWGSQNKGTRSEKINKLRTNNYIYFYLEKYFVLKNLQLSKERLVRSVHDFVSMDPATQPGSGASTFTLFVL